MTTLTGAPTTVAAPTTQPTVLEQLLSEVRDMHSDMNTMKTDMKRIESRLEKLTLTVGDIDFKVGITYEAATRQEVARVHGYRFSQRFDLKDLMGVVRLAFPKEKIEGETHHYSDTAGVQERRATQLADAIYTNKLRIALELRVADFKDNALYTELCKRAQQAIDIWKEKETKKDATQLRHQFIAHHNGIGIMLLTARAIVTPDPSCRIPPFYDLLEVDCRGRVDLHGTDDVHITVGEIKCTKVFETLRHGIFQVYLRLCVLSWAVHYIRPKSRIYAIGHLYVPAANVPGDDVQRCAESVQHKLAWPPQTVAELKCIQMNNSA
jgi:hypothetical protein